MVDFNVLGFHIGTTALIGVGAGLLTWFLEDAVAAQINDKKWVLPLIGGFTAAGAYAFFVKGT
jgi:predicted membrane-bound spermidine synthase